MALAMSRMVQHVNVSPCKYDTRHLQVQRSAVAAGWYHSRLKSQIRCRQDYLGNMPAVVLLGLEVSWEIAGISYRMTSAQMQAPPHFQKDIFSIQQTDGQNKFSSVETNAQEQPGTIDCCRSLAPSLGYLNGC